MTCRLLIVDDSATFLGLMKDFLQRAGFLVDTAISGEKAIEKVGDSRNRYPRMKPGHTPENWAEWRPTPFSAIR